MSDLYDYLERAAGEGGPNLAGTFFDQEIGEDTIETFMPTSSLSVPDGEGGFDAVDAASPLPTREHAPLEVSSGTFSVSDVGMAFSNGTATGTPTADSFVDFPTLNRKTAILSVSAESGSDLILLGSLDGALWVTMHLYSCTDFSV